MTVIEALLSLGLLPPETPGHQAAVQLLQRQRAQDWVTSFGILHAHRIDLFVHAALRTSPLWANIPDTLRQRIEACAEATRRAETLGQVAAAAGGAALREAGIDAVACKGIVLAMDYYAERGLRPMQDIDLWIDTHQMQTCTDTMEQLGFHCENKLPADRVRIFRNAWGIAFDIHTEMSLFQSAGWSTADLSRPHATQPFRVFCPEATLAHLLVHMIGHIREIGLLVGWLVDLVLVLREHLDQLQWQMVRSLLPRNGTWQLFLRFLLLFEASGWIVVPSDLEPEIRRLRQVEWSVILRQRRLAAWGLPRPRGWARWARAQLFGAAPDRPQPLPPTPGDLILWVRDALIEQTALFHREAAMLTRRNYEFRRGDPEAPPGRGDEATS
ncbi:MAG: nucleotidyltransferase family protein [Nannocystaceae bacterium]